MMSISIVLVVVLVLVIEPGRSSRTKDEYGLL
jgi:hypothetical protein